MADTSLNLSLRFRCRLTHPTFLGSYLEEVTNRVITTSIYADSSEAEVRQGRLKGTEFKE
ncbi:MAG: hypothetical protein RIG63_00620 [Coleofasciculus chthonoplastes F3-SA18-01]|uniref:hypothetical protein n=1 Tax=Coleofasciculus chthonoplastes TaxID=64178 RepID=UPI0032F2AD85